MNLDLTAVWLFQNMAFSNAEIEKVWNWGSQTMANKGQANPNKSGQNPNHNKTRKNLAKVGFLRFSYFFVFFPPQFFLHFHEAKILNQIDQVRTDQNLVKPGECDSEKPLSFVGLERRVKGSMEVVVWTAQRKTPSLSNQKSKGADVLKWCSLTQHVTCNVSHVTCQIKCKFWQRI